MKVTAKQSKWRQNEQYNRAIALNEADIAQECIKSCKTSRIASGCPNNKCCANKFGGPISVFSAVREIRERIWMFPDGTKARKARLGEILLENLLVDETNERKYKFRIRGIDVCKDFFKVTFFYL